MVLESNYDNTSNIITVITTEIVITITIIIIVVIMIIFMFTNYFNAYYW